MRTLEEGGEFLLTMWGVGTTTAAEDNCNPSWSQTEDSFLVTENVTNTGEGGGAFADTLGQRAFTGIAEAALVIEARFPLLLIKCGNFSTKSRDIHWFRNFWTHHRAASYY